MKKLAFFNRITLSLCLALGLLVTACTPDEMETIAEEEQELAQLDAAVEADFEGVDQVSYEAMDEAFGRRYAGQGLLNACVTVTHDTASRILTLDFGSGCVGPDGKTRAGKIILDYTQRLWRPGASLTITLDSFHVDDRHIQGAKTHQNLANSLQDPITIQSTLVGGSITWPDGSQATREFDRTRTWLRAANPVNDQLTVSGNATGTRRDGSTYSTTIVNPKVYQRSCRRQGIRLPGEGTVLLQRSGQPDLTLDFGNGACDSEITLTKNGQSRTITL